MPKARYDGIANSLREALIQGAYPPGTLLPSEHALAAAHGCSRNTVRRALAALADEGWVQPVQGKGVRVLARPELKGAFVLGGVESFQEMARRCRRTGTTRVVQFSRMRVDRALAEETGFVQGETVCSLQRLRYLEGRPLILEASTLSEALVPGLTEDIASHSIYAYIEETLGMGIAASRRTFTVERTTALDRWLLELGACNCLATVTARTYNSGGLLFEYRQTRYHPDCFCFQDTAVRERPQR